MGPLIDHVCGSRKECMRSKAVRERFHPAWDDACSLASCVYS